MTPREQMIAALERRPPAGHVPHFELAFYLTMEAFGRVHPRHRNYAQWDQMREEERRLHVADMADLYVRIAERYSHSAILVSAELRNFELDSRIIGRIREVSGDGYFLMALLDPTFRVPPGDKITEFACRLADEPDKVKKEASLAVDRDLALADKYARCGGLDGFALCADYCFNTGPFLSPGQFSEFVAPYLRRAVDGYRARGFYSIKHTDGNIMPILDQLAECRPDALHSLDPQGGVDIAEVKRRCGDRLCLIGNVNCGLLDTGSDEECIASARYALRHGMPGGGYVFSTSNCIYTGMRLERYELIHKVWRDEGCYPSP